MAIKADDGRKHRKRKTTMSRSDIMAILIFFISTLSVTLSYISQVLFERMFDKGINIVIGLRAN